MGVTEEFLARIQLLEQQLNEVRQAILEQDPLPNLQRYTNVPLAEAVRSALKERYAAAVYWQNSSHKHSDEIRILITAIGALNEAKELVINSHAE